MFAALPRDLLNIAFLRDGSLCNHYSCFVFFLKVDMTSTLLHVAFSQNTNQAQQSLEALTKKKKGVTNRQTAPYVLLDVLMSNCPNKRC